MSDPSNQRSTRAHPNLLPKRNPYADNWTEVGGCYFIKPPVVTNDNHGNTIKSDFGALEMKYIDETNGFSMFAKGLWPPNNAIFPYGGPPDGFINEKEYENIAKHNIPKYGGASRTHYMVQYTQNNEAGYVDGHPRHARNLNYPEDCCWPGSRLQTCERGKKRANVVLDRIDELGFIVRFEPLPKEAEYPYIHWPIFAITTKPVKDGEELLVRYGWTKNALTRFIGPETKRLTGRRKSGKTSGEKTVPESSESVSNDILIIYLLL
jgi:hypothetical protein